MAVCFYNTNFPGEYIWKCRYYNSVENINNYYTEENNKHKIKEYRAMNEQELRDKQNEGMDETWTKI